MDILSVVTVGFILLFYVLVLGISLADYILRSLGQLRLAKKMGVSHSWLSWIPIGREWILGSLVDAVDRKRGLNRRWRVAILVTELLMFFSVVIYYVALIVVTVIGIGMGFSDIVMSFLPLFMVYIGMIPLMLSSVALIVLQVACEYKIYDELCPAKTVKYLLLSFLVPMAYGIFLLRLAKHYEGAESTLGSGYENPHKVDTF